MKFFKKLAMQLEEKQLKVGSRKNKLDLITSLNPGWKDLYDEIVEQFSDLN